MSNCKRALLASMAACLIGVTSAWGEIVVITHRANPLTELTAEQLEKIFLRKVQTFPDGKSAVPLDIPRGKLRDAFYAHITGGKNNSQLRAYWSKVVFTSGGKPPQEVLSEQEAVGIVQRNTNYIAYVEREQANNLVKVVYSLAEPKL